MSNRKFDRNRSARKGRGRSLIDLDFADALRGGRDRERHEKPNYKTQQLCRQVQQALMLALAADGDDLVRELMVHDVAPAGNASTLFVQLLLPRDARVGVVEAMEHVSRAEGRLRCAVAGAITRKRVPQLVYIVVPASGEVGHEQ